MLLHAYVPGTVLGTEDTEETQHNLVHKEISLVEEISNWCVTQVAVATCSEREQVIVLGGEECENQLQKRCCWS